MIIVILGIQPGWNFIKKFDIGTRLVSQNFDIGSNIGPKPPQNNHNKLIYQQ